MKKTIMIICGVLVSLFLSGCSAKENSIVNEFFDQDISDHRLKVVIDYVAGSLKKEIPNCNVSRLEIMHFDNMITKKYIKSVEINTYVDKDTKEEIEETTINEGTLNDGYIYSIYECMENDKIKTTIEINFEATTIKKIKE